MLLRLLAPLLFLTTSLLAQQTDSSSIPDISVNDADSIFHHQSAHLDSIQNSFYLQSDSLKAAYKYKMASVEASKIKVSHTIDSLQSLNLNPDAHLAKLDSLEGKRAELAASLDSKMNALKDKASKNIGSLDLPPQLKDKASAINKNIADFQLPVKDLNISSLNLADSPLKNLDGLNTSIQSPVGEIGKLPGVDALKIPGTENLNIAAGDLKIPGADNLGDLSKVTDQAGGYSNDLKEITNGNLDGVKQIPDALEGKAAEVAGLPDAPDAKSLMGDVPALPTNPGEAKDQAQQQVQQAINHFAGKEQVLQQAMDKMAKLKRKYSSLNSLSEIPKHRPNEMRGKSLKERIIPALVMQIQGKGDNILVDLNPAAGYRLTGKLTAGLGYNYRIAYNKRFDGFTALPRVYGPRAFSEFKIGKGFSPRAEFEVMNAPVPPMIQKLTADYSDRQWVPGAFVGIKKDYSVFKNVRGTSMVMLRIFNQHHKSPYADVVNVRIGFDFPMKKKIKTKKSESPPADTKDHK